VKRVTKLPLWYLIGVIVVVLVSFINYMGMQRAIKLRDISLAIRYQYMDFILIGLWLAVNVIMTFYLLSEKAKKKEFIFPLYFIGVHLFYIGIIIASYMNRFLPRNVAMIISAITSFFEIGYAGYLLIPYVKAILSKPAAKQHTVPVKKKINKRAKSSKTKKRK
jgi:hypothetical protein